jgi:hypothetical protein
MPLALFVASFASSTETKNAFALSAADNHFGLDSAASVFPKSYILLSLDQVAC